ncbi:uncharacterized protein G2W53_020106 [Senna tora]|uniref:Uncharacterized protein n=1 Tax=Senna tora TaxID=362788 RepID=A0A834TXB7_9FABA|nr:uncharacterized protein G2W53_020106 [Senna tora]
MSGVTGDEPSPIFRLLGASMGCSRFPLYSDVMRPELPCLWSMLSAGMGIDSSIGTPESRCHMNESEIVEISEDYSN